MTVVIMTHTQENESYAVVARALEELGHEAVRCDTDLFPTQVRLAVHHDGGGERVVLTTPDADALDLGGVDAIWNRRYYVGRGIPEDLDPQLRQPSRDESRRSLLGGLDCLDVFFLDPLMYSGHQARSKPLQLRIARQLGLEIPRTLTTNDPAAVRGFAAACGGDVVCKMMSSFAVFDDEGRDHVVFTNPLSAADLEDMTGLDLCPMTFQENVAKARELRVTVAGYRVFAAEIDSQSSERARHDWRRDGAEMIGDWRPTELPAELERRLLALCDRLRLNYGAIDLILTPDGRYVFLEINPVGEFFWLEVYQKMPISRAIAEVLVDPEKRRVNQDLLPKRDGLRYNPPS